MEKRQRKIISFLLVFLLFLEIFFPLLNIKAASTNISEVIKDIEKLESLAEDYIFDGNVGNVNDLVIGYISNNGYDDTWKGVIVNSNSSFESRVSSYTDSDLTYLRTLTDISNGDTRVDFHLLVNCLNALNNSNSIYFNYGYSCVSAIKSLGLREETVDSLMTQISFTNDTCDMNAYMDAYLIKPLLNNNRLSSALNSYYSGKVDSSRIKRFTDEILVVGSLTKENIRDVVYNKLINDSIVIGNLSNSGINTSNATNLFKASSYTFADYIFRNHPYAIIVDTPGSGGGTTSTETIVPIAPTDPSVIPITGITVKNLKENIKVGSRMLVEINIVPANHTQAYYMISTNPSVANFEGSELVAYNEGTTTIRIYNETESINKEYVVNVIGNVSSILSNKTEYELNVGEEVKLDYRFNVESLDDFVKWESQSDVISLDANGKIKALKVGHAKVYCKLLSDETIFLEYNISVKSPMKSIKIDNKSNVQGKEGVFLGVGETYMLRINVDPASEAMNKGYKTSNLHVCSIENGKITAISSGTATIEVYSIFDDKIVDTVQVTVLAPITNCLFSRNLTKIDMAESKEAIVNAKLSPNTNLDYDSFKFILYKIEDDGDLKEDYNWNALTYDYETGKIEAKNVGKYKISCINKKTREEINYFTVEVTYTREEEPFFDSIIEDKEPSSPIISDEAANNLTQAVLVIIGALIVLIIFLLALYFIFWNKNSGDDEDDEDDDYEDELVKKKKKKVVKKKEKEVQIDNVRPITKEVINKSQALKEFEPIKDDSNIESIDDELDRLIKKIVDSTSIDDNLLIDGMDIDSYLSNEVENILNEENVEIEENNDEKEDIDNDLKDM